MFVALGFSSVDDTVESFVADVVDKDDDPVDADDDPEVDAETPSKKYS